MEKLDEKQEIEIAARGAREVNKAIFEWEALHGSKVTNREMFIFAFTKGAGFGVLECGLVMRELEPITFRVGDAHP